MCFGSVRWLDVGINLVLWFSWTGVVETLEGISYVGDHGEVCLAIHLVQVDVHSKVT